MQEHQKPRCLQVLPLQWALLLQLLPLRVLLQQILPQKVPPLRVPRAEPLQALQGSGVRVQGTVPLRRSRPRRRALQLLVPRQQALPRWVLPQRVLPLPLQVPLLQELLPQAPRAALLQALLLQTQEDTFHQPMP